MQIIPSNATLLPMTYKYLISLCCAAVCLLGASSLLANGILHVIIVADTHSHTGDAAILELKHVTQEFVRVSEFTKMDLRQQVFQGVDNRDVVWQAVKDLHVSSDDCVVFYYIGHGYRTSRKTTPWPYLYFSRESVNLDMQSVLDEVIAKKPRFGLLLADCCNNVMDGVVRIALHPLFHHRRDPSMGYRKLFLQSTGFVVIAASVAGGYAYCDDYGHCYSQAFWKALHTEIRQDDPQWRHILDQTKHALVSIQVPYEEILVYP